MSDWSSDLCSSDLIKGWALSLAVTIWLVVPLVPFLTAQLEAYAERGAGLSMPSAAGTDSSSVLDAMSSYALIANVIWAVGGYHSDDVMTRPGAPRPDRKRGVEGKGGVVRVKLGGRRYIKK